MSKENNLKEKLENVNDNFEFDLKMKQLKEELLKNFSQYQDTMKYLTADTPIQTLCLAPVIENILLRNGFLRIYDLFNVDFFEIKGLGDARIRELTSRLDQFFSM